MSEVLQNVFKQQAKTVMDSFGLEFVAKPKLYAGYAAFIDARAHTLLHRYQRSRSAQTARELFLSKIASIGY